MSVKTGVGKNVIATVLVAVIAVGMLGAYHTILIKDLKKKEEVEYKEDKLKVLQARIDELQAELLEEMTKRKDF